MSGEFWSRWKHNWLGPFLCQESEWQNIARCRSDRSHCRWCNLVFWPPPKPKQFKVSEAKAFRRSWKRAIVPTPTAYSYNQVSLTHRLQAHKLTNSGRKWQFFSPQELSGQRVQCRSTQHWGQGKAALAQDQRSSQHSRTGKWSCHSLIPAGFPPCIVSFQCAAKVVFFKLKLDQLMESLCLVCLAESKQNLKRKKSNKVKPVYLKSIHTCYPSFGEMLSFRNTKPYIKKKNHLSITQIHNKTVTFNTTALWELSKGGSKECCTFSSTEAS